MPITITTTNAIIKKLTTSPINTFKLCKNKG